jgi:hypothetical protein
VNRDQIGMMIAFKRLKPEHSFASAPPAARPTMRSPRAGPRCRIGRTSGCRCPAAMCRTVRRLRRSTSSSCIPTTFFGTASWNQALDDTSTNQLTDTFVLRGQASVFNSCCKIYAPRYRQATIYSFMDRSGSGRAALELAYEDVERAFDYFIEHYNQGRPFILASHSQGSLHLRKLLEKRITGKPMRERLVAAYPIGFGIDRDELAKAVPDVPVCESAEQIGCVVTWNAVGPKVKKWTDSSKTLCVNPLTWRTDGAPADASLNIGGVSYAGTFSGSLADVKGVPQDFVDAKPILEPGRRRRAMRRRHAAGERDPLQVLRARPMGRDNYHIYDYNLFHMNLRKNIEGRVAKYLGVGLKPDHRLVGRASADAYPSIASLLYKRIASTTNSAPSSSVVPAEMSACSGGIGSPRIRLVAADAD